MMSTVEALERIAHNQWLERSIADLATEALPQARLEAKVIEAAREVELRHRSDRGATMDRLRTALDALREGS